MPWPEDPLVAAELEAWLERRFPGGGSAGERLARNRQRLRVLVPVAVIVTIAVAVPSFRGYLSSGHDAPTLQDAHPWLFVPAIVAAAAALVLPVVALARAAGVSKVTRAERGVVSLLTRDERNELRRELTADEPPREDEEALDVVAKVWWSDRWQPALWAGLALGQVAGIAFSPLGLADPLRLTTLVMLAATTAIVVPRARAARTWLRRRAP